MNTLVKIGVAILVLVGAFTATWFVYYPHSPLGKQEANLRLAEEHKPKAEASLRRMAGADKVRVVAYPGCGGSLNVSGEVADEQTAEGVMNAVLASSPPVAVEFLLAFGETNLIRKVIEPGAVPNQR